MKKDKEDHYKNFKELVDCVEVSRRLHAMTPRFDTDNDLLAYNRLVLKDNLRRLRNDNINMAVSCLEELREDTWNQDKISFIIDLLERSKEGVI